jgi:hypothetical protein
MTYTVEMDRCDNIYSDTGAIGDGYHALDLCRKGLRRVWDIPRRTNRIWLTVHLQDPKKRNAVRVELERVEGGYFYVAEVPGYTKWVATIYFREYPLKQILSRYDKPPKTITVWFTVEYEEA